MQENPRKPAKIMANRAALVSTLWSSAGVRQTIISGAFAVPSWARYRVYLFVFRRVNPVELPT
jgi:hypothetical protein